MATRSKLWTHILGPPETAKVIMSDLLPSAGQIILSNSSCKEQKYSFLLCKLVLLLAEQECSP